MAKMPTLGVNVIDYKDQYGAALDRERVWLEIIDDLLTAIASDNRTKLSKAYNRAAYKIAEVRSLKSPVVKS